MPIKETKIVLISGGAHGLGKYLGEKLSAAGHSIIILDRIPIEQIDKYYQQKICNYYEVDLSEWEQVDKTVDEIFKQYQRVDILINNAATRLFKDFSKFTVSEIDAFLYVNFRTPLLLIKKVFPLMQSNKYGRIINISSKSGFWGYQTGSMYCSTKSALIRFTESFGGDLSKKENVTVNVICPDSFRTIDGEKLKGCDQIINKIGQKVEHLMTSNDNGKVIPILRLQTRIYEFLRTLKKHTIWFLRG